MSEFKPYAIVKASGKQVRVCAGDKIVVNHLESDIGAAVTLGEVLAMSSVEGELKIGTPLLSGIAVTAKVVAHDRGKKVTTFKKRRRTGYTKKIGHRQELTTLLIESIA